MLTFLANKQVLTRTDNSLVVADSVEYLIAKFMFADGWDGKAKTVVFGNGTDVYTVPLVGDSCMVPWEVLKASAFKVSVYGTHDDERITTNMILIPVNESGYSEGLTPQPPTPDVYEQIMDFIEELDDEIQSRAMPEAPTTDGTYTLKVTVSDGTPTYSWVADN